jgi:hypothetical protein
MIFPFLTSIRDLHGIVADFSDQIDLDNHALPFIREGIQFWDTAADRGSSPRYCF